MAGPMVRAEETDLYADDGDGEAAADFDAAAVRATGCSEPKDTLQHAPTAGQRSLGAAAGAPTYRRSFPTMGGTASPCRQLLSHWAH
jgi:hypothetical protein